MAVVTISRELGCNGDAIGRTVAETLGYDFVDKQTMETILREYGVPQFERIYESYPSFWDRFDQARATALDMLDRVIRGLARRGDAVILGRGGFAVLSGLADVLNVRLRAARAIRVRRVMALEGITDEHEADALLGRNDRMRAAFVESIYPVRWNDLDAFDLVIDTGKVLPDLAGDWIVSVVRSWERTPIEGDTAADLEPDPILDEYLAGVFAG
jgi:cytidylate kinase